MHDLWWPKLLFVHTGFTKYIRSTYFTLQALSGYDTTKKYQNNIDLQV
jgi:hypothetical protein